MEGHIRKVARLDPAHSESRNNPANRYRSLYEESGVPITVFRVVAGGEDFLLVDSNSAAEQAYHIYKYRDRGKSVTTFFTQEDAVNRSHFVRAFREGRCVEEVSKLDPFTGTTEWWRYELYRLGTGEIACCCLNETEWKRAKQERDLFFDFSGNLLCIVSRDGYFRQVNPAWEKALGWSTEELLHRPLIDFVNLDDRNNTLIFLEQLQAGNQLHGLVNRFSRKDGSLCWISWDSFVLTDENLIFGQHK